MKPNCRTISALLVGVVISHAACHRSKAPVTAGTPDAVVGYGDLSVQEPSDLNKQIVSAIQGGRYADAVQLARQAHVPKAESDFAVGNLILQGHADARAAQVPRETIEDGLRMIEGAALVGHQQAISSLAATFNTGLGGAGNAFLIQPDARLNRCWDDVKSAPQKARSCIDMRRK